METKERILWTAIRLFARHGYEAVSVSQLADRLGMAKSALYKHYVNKQDIFDSIVRRMEQLDRENAAACELPIKLRTEDPAAYGRAGLENLTAFSQAQFRYWTENEFAACFRRLLTLEQYHSPAMGQLYQQYLGAGPLRYVEDLLAGMGWSQPAARQLALEFYGPMFLSYSLYDGAAADADRTAVTERLCRYMRDFIGRWKREEKGNEI